MRFEAVPTQEVDAVWDGIRPGVEHIIKLCHEDFRQEAVYMALVSGKATLFIFKEANVAGFAVLEIMPGQKLNVWLMHLVNRTDAVRTDLVAFLDDCARKANCRTVRFMSPRAGWEKFLHGEFHKKAVIYERVVK